MKKIKEKLSKLKNKLKKVIKSTKKSICNELFVMDSLFLLGIMIIIVTNFIINIVFGLYFLGLTLMGFSIFLNRTKKK